VSRYAEFQIGFSRAAYIVARAHYRLRNKAGCKDAVCSFVYRRACSHHLTTAMPPSTGPPKPMKLDSLGKSLQTE
jgi:hypothetical protein